MTEPHSQLYFTDARDHWWHDDYVALLARRFELGRARRVLDVGAGQGHFARLWAPHLAADVEITCVDREQRSLDVAAQRAGEVAAGKRFTFVCGSAEELPFDGGTFDLVMCQTLLIHVRDPAAVVAEMTRVARTGGRILAAEPNNLVDAQRLAARGPDADVDAALRELRLQQVVVRGKYRLGLGWNHLGVHLPRYLSQLDALHYYVNDRVMVLAPPYATPTERALVADCESYVARGIWGWEREEARTYYEAGGGDPATFDTEYDAGLASQLEELATIRRSEWHEVGAVALFVGSGLKR